MILNRLVVNDEYRSRKQGGKVLVSLIWNTKKKSEKKNV